MRRLFSATLKILLGLVLGLVLAEIAFRVRDDGAFPHVNLYLPDPELGTRLEPFATQRLAFTGNPPTGLRINSRGFRGGEWPEPVKGEVIVVGDSQVFGLGVEEDETFPAQLAKRSGRQVLNAGVPTYGPGEYLAVARRLVTQRPGAHVLLVFNVANDFFELSRPNTTRHAVWDGWAVRKENRPAELSQFPGRRWLFSQSHLVFAARKLQLERQQAQGDSEALVNFGPAKGADPGTASEGTWSDLLTAREQQERQLADEKARLQRERAAAQQRITPIQAQVEAEQLKVQDLEDKALNGGSRLLRSERLIDQVLSKQSGDIVLDTGSERARSIPVPAELLAEATREKKRLTEARARFEQERAPHDELIRRDYAELEALRWAIPGPALEPPTLGEDFLGELAAFQKSTAEVTVVVLPLDVQVSKDEWAKYGVAGRDLSETLELNQAFAAAAQRRGLRAIDVGPALRDAEPGAFLKGDLHMTTKGIAAVAAFVSAALLQPAPTSIEVAWPEGVSALPSPPEWNAVGENTVKGSTAAGCETKQVREWLRVRCTETKTGGTYGGVRLAEGKRSEVQLTWTRVGASAVVPVRNGERTRVAFSFFDADGEPYERVLRVEPSKFEFEKDVAGQVATGWVPQAAKEFIACHARFSGQAVPWGNLEPGSPCLKYTDCARQLACAQGHPNAQPPCADGQVNAGADHRCLRACSDERPCEGGQTCRPWQAVRACF